MAKKSEDLKSTVARLAKRLEKLELEVFPPEQKPAAQRKRLEHMLRRIDGRSLQTWYRETGHDDMAQLILSLPDDIVDRMRLSAPRSLWQRWIESAEFVGPAPSGAARNVQDALIGLKRLEEMGAIWVVEDGEKFVRPASISAAKWKRMRADIEQKLEERSRADERIKRMKKLL